MSSMRNLVSSCFVENLCDREVRENDLRLTFRTLAYVEIDNEWLDPSVNGGEACTAANGCSKNHKASITQMPRYVNHEEPLFLGTVRHRHWLRRCLKIIVEGKNQRKTNHGDAQVQLDSNKSTMLAFSVNTRVTFAIVGCNLEIWRIVNVLVPFLIGI